MFNRVAIVGLGLIGGSIGLALRGAKAGQQGTGYHLGKGVNAALFQNRIYCLTPTRRTSSAALNKVTQFIEVLGARVRFLEPAEHDGQVAYVSHLPFVVSTILMNTVAESPAWGDAVMLSGR